MSKHIVRPKKSASFLTGSKSRWPVMVFTILVAMIGVLVILRSFAATPNALRGDINGDNTVNVVDLSMLLSNWNKTPGSGGSLNADINADNRVDITDLAILLGNFNKTGTVTPPAPTPPTPEPNGWDPPAVKRNLGFDPACDFSQWDEVLNKEVGSVEIVRSPVIEGTCAAKFTQNSNTTGIWRRVELQNHNPANGAVPGEGGEAWYQFKIYPISSGSSDYTINQFRTDGVSCYTGGTDFYPNNKIKFIVRGGSFTGGDDDGCSFPTEKEYDIGSFSFNKWYTLQYHYLWSAGSKGRAEVWLDGTKVVDFTGPTAAKGATRIMFRTGIYSGPHSGSHSFVIDDAKIYTR